MRILFSTECRHASRGLISQNRRLALLAVLLGAFLVPAFSSAASAAVTCPNSNPVVNENNCTGAGSSGWEVQNYSEDIGGFTTQTSYNVGTNVPLKLGTDLSGAQKVNLSVYRIGYYNGAGGRLVYSQSAVSVNNSFTCGAANPTTGELSCANWAASATIPSTSLPVSGIYEALFTDPGSGNIQNYVVFVVRNDASTSDILYDLPSASYEAYNTWGCKSLYYDKCGGANTISGADRAVQVSFDRPLDFGMMQTNRFFGPDMETVQWLEQEGYNVSYTDDIQTDQSPSTLLHHKIFLISGHSEYWSTATYNNIMAARNAGVSIVSLSGNTAYWNTRYTDSYRTLVCYKTVQGPNTPNDPASLNSSGQVGPGDNPSLATTTRRDPGAPDGTAGAPAGGRLGPNTPENQLLGSMYIGDNDAEYWGLTVPASDGFGNFAGNDLWRNSGLSTATATTISADIVGWEWDTIPSANSPLYSYAASVEPAGVQQVASTNVSKPAADTPDSFIQDYGNLRATTAPTGQPPTSSATMYRAASGAYVFAAGTILWANGFGDPRIDQVTYNAMSDMGAQPATPADITVDTAGQPARPWASFTASPNPVRFGSPVTLDASGTFDGSGASITSYQWDFNGNGTWVNNGTSSSVSHTWATQGTYNVHLKITDSLGRTSITTRVLTVQGDPPPTASLVTNPAKPVVGQTVTLDGSGSTGPVNPIVDYKWDLTGSGTYSQDTGTTPTTTTTFSTTGFHTVGLQVTDSKGVSSTTTLQVTVLGTGASSYEDAVNVTPGLMHYFKLGESAGPTIADSAGGPSGTVAGGTFGQPGPIQGDPTTAIGFNGSSNFGQIPMNLSSTGTVTVEFWLKWNSYANDDALAMEFTPNFNNQTGGFLVDPDASDGTFSVAIGQGASRNIAAFTRPTAGAWHYYAFVLDTTQPGATTVTPYVDGQPISYTKQGASGTGAGNFANSTLYLMSRDGAQLFGNGSLGQVAIYNGTLNQQRIQDHFNSNGTNPRPKASFTISPSPAALNRTVTFDASGSTYKNGSIVKYEWDLNGTGSYTQTTTTPTITTTYSTEKTITVGLRVTDSDFGTDYTTQTLFVGAAPPVASLKVNPNPAIVNQNITFDATGSSVPNGSITDVKWDFDGSGTFATDTGTTLKTTHSFSTIGVHPVGLQLTSDGGKVTKTTVNVTALDTGVGDYEDAVLNTPGVQHYYKLGEKSGPSIADSAGSANGTISGATFGQAGPVANDPTTAVSFNGTSDSGAIPMDLSGSKTLTVEFWLKWNAYANDDALAMEYTPNFNNQAGGFLVDPNSSFGQFAVAIGQGSSRNIATFARPSAGVWHHYAFVLDTTQPGATTIRPYVDGQTVSYTNQGYGGTGAGNFANSTLYLMSRDGNALFGNGTLGQVAIYSGALTGNQVLDHYYSQGTNKPPTAAFTASPARAAVGQNVTFDASGSSDPAGSIVDYQWDLDGSGKFATDTGSTPTLTTSFAKAGSYSISLRVIDNGNASNTVTHTFTVGDDPPTPAFTFNPSPLALAGHQVSFDGSGSSDANGTITDYKWDLDGSGAFATDTGTTPSTSFTYASPGTYNVGLRVTNDAGQSTTISHTVDVHAATYKSTVTSTAGLVSYWRLGDAPGSTTLADASGPNAATDFGATLGTPGALFGDAGTSATFNGTSNYASAPIDLSATSKVTVEFWLNWAAYANNDALAMEYTPNFNNQPGGFLVDPNASTGSFGVAIGSGSGREDIYFPRPSAGAWHYYAFVFDTTAAAGAQITPYVDGKPVTYSVATQGTGAGNFANSTLYLMSRDGNALFGAASLQEVAIYNQPLTAPTIAAHYAAGTP
ncbi:MAG: N,N-dimethylformamidase beta subunit family domain-containing protein [Solirubrobacteraceae bacterium]